MEIQRLWKSGGEGCEKDLLRKLHSFRMALLQEILSAEDRSTPVRGDRAISARNQVLYDEAEGERNSYEQVVQKSRRNDAIIERLQKSEWNLREARDKLRETEERLVDLQKRREKIRMDCMCSKAERDQLLTRIRKETKLLRSVSADHRSLLNLVQGADVSTERDRELESLTRNLKAEVSLLLDWLHLEDGALRRIQERRRTAEVDLSDALLYEEDPGREDTGTADEGRESKAEESSTSEQDTIGRASPNEEILSKLYDSINRRLVSASRALFVVQDATAHEKAEESALWREMREREELTTQKRKGRPLPRVIPRKELEVRLAVLMAGNCALWEAARSCLQLREEMLSMAEQESKPD